MNLPVPTLIEFLTNLEKQFEGMRAGTLSESTEFKKLAEWSSIQSLVVLASFSWDYGINLPADVFREAKTFGDIYHSLFNSKF